MQHVFPYIKRVKIYIIHGLCYHVTHRYAVVNDVHMVIFVSMSQGTKDSFYAWFMHITTYIYACVYRLTRITWDSWLSSAWLTQARVHWADRDLADVLAGASPTNGSPGLPLPLPYIYIISISVSAILKHQFQRSFCIIFLFQINSRPSHLFISNQPSHRRPRATALAETQHTGLLTVPCRTGPLAHRAIW
jgi:hypothetical protein